MMLVSSAPFNWQHVCSKTLPDDEWIKKNMTRLTAFAGACACVLAYSSHSIVQAPSASAQSGIASYYGAGHHGRRTASGERFNQNDMTAAHRTARFGTRLRVTNTVNGRSVVVRVNDRGPFTRGRVIDVSTAAARSLGFVARGTTPVRIETVATR
jgi:rare lipoprotein A